MPKDLAFCLKLDLVGAYLMLLKEFLGYKERNWM